MLRAPNPQGTTPNSLPGIQNLVPDAGARSFIRRNVDFETVFRAYSRAAEQNIFQSADCAASDPIELDRARSASVSF